jgi:hypothetical protein
MEKGGVRHWFIDERLRIPEARELLRMPKTVG